MMRRLFFAALLFWAGASFAHAQLSTGLNPNLIVCPMGVFSDDGCGSAPAPTTAFFRVPDAFKPGGHFNRASATFTNYSASICGPSGAAPCRPPWNVPAVDYAIGNYTPVASLLDPAAVSIPGCAYSITASTTGGGLFTCGGGTFAGVLQHLNFGQVTGSGAHGCTALRLNATTAASVLIDDDYFFNDTGLCSFFKSTGNPNVAFGTMIASGSGFASPVTITSTYMDGNASVWRTTVGGCAPDSCNPVAAIGIQGADVTVEYSVINHFAGRPISMPVSTAFIFKYNYFEGSNYSALNGHAEMFLGPGSGSSMANLTIQHNALVERWDNNQFGPGLIFPATNWPVDFPILHVDNNVVIEPFIGRSTKTSSISGCTGLTFDGTNCSGTGPTFWLTAISPSTGNIGTGLIFGCGSGAAAISLVAQTGGPGTGYLSTWSFDSGSTYAPAPIPANSCTGVAVGAGPWSTALFSGGAVGHVGTSSFSNNYIDASSIGGAPGSQGIQSIGSITGPVSFTGTVSGNALLAQGTQTLSAGELIYAADVPGCSSGALSCLSVVTGGPASIFTLSGSASVGPETLEGFVNETSFNATISGTSMTTSTSKTLTGGDYVLGAATCGANPNTCPKIAATTTGTAFTLSTSGGTVASPTAMNTLRNTVNFNGTIDNGAVTGPSAGSSLIPSVTLFVESFINGTGVTGCSIGLYSCPQIAGANATATRFTLSAGGGSIGAEAMTANQASYCDTPTTFSGNIGMSGDGGDADLNTWQYNTFHSGC